MSTAPLAPARLSVRVLASSPPADLTPTIELFHRCIQRGLLAGLLLDVADYRHVPDGPGVLLVGHDVDHGVDDRGLVVTRKRSTDDAATQLQDALRAVLAAADVLDADPALDVELDRTRLEITVPDRSLGDRDELAARLRDELTPVLTGLLGDDTQVTVVDGDARGAATLQVTAPQGAAAEALATLGGDAAPGQSPYDLSVEELARLREEDDGSLVVLDVREPSEVAEVSLGGRNIPLGELGDRLDELDRGARIVVHCRAGRRGATAVEQLRAAGFDDAWNVNGALVAWRERIDPSLPVV